MTPDDLAAIRARAEAATSLEAHEELAAAIGRLSRVAQYDIPALLAEVERLQGWVDGYKGAAVNSVAIAKEVGERLEQAARERDEAREECRLCRDDIRRLVEVRDEALAERDEARAEIDKAREGAAYCDERVQKALGVYFEQAREECTRDQCYGLATIMVVAIEKMKDDTDESGLRAQRDEARDAALKAQTEVTFGIAEMEKLRAEVAMHVKAGNFLARLVEEQRAALSAARALCGEANAALLVTGSCLDSELRARLRAEAAKGGA